jgi:hypothetical protein
LIVEDLSQQIEDRNITYSNNNPTPLSSARSSVGFDFGSMGGFYTWSEVIERLDFMRCLFSIISLNYLLHNK